MDEEPRDVGSQVADGDDPVTIRAKIEETRGDLGDTVAALSDETDVKARTREKVKGARATVLEKAGDARATVSEKADEFASKAHDAIPAGAQARVSDLSRRVRRDRRRAVVIVGVVLGLLVVLRRMRGRASWSYVRYVRLPRSRDA
jgi:Protein of unknown function (DUF3618)